MKKIILLIIIPILFGYSYSYADWCAQYIVVTSTLKPNCCLELTITNTLDYDACDGFDIGIYETDDYGNMTETLGTYTVPFQQTITVEICSKAGDNTIGWKLYMPNDPTTHLPSYSGVVDISSCCHCPETKNSWLSFTSEYNGPDCGPNQCKITPVVTIPPDITCYKYYAGVEVNIEGDYNPTTSISTPLPSYCVDKGVSLDYVVTLLKNPNDDPNESNCILEAVSPPCDKPEAVPCTPDCEETPFPDGNRKTHHFELTTCPGCFIDVTYTWRIACPEQYQDIQILEIEFPAGSPCANCFIEDIYATALAGIIGLSNQTIGFAPLSNPDCSTQWRVANAGCWGKEHLYYQVGSSGVTREVVRWHPCECIGCNCCYQQLQVCRTGPSQVTITPIGPPTIQGTCTGFVVGDNHQQFYCIPACEWAGQVNGVYDIPIVDGIGTHGKISTETDILEHRIITKFSNDKLDIELHTKSAKSAILNLYDINGNLVATDDYPVLTGLNIFHFNTKSFNSGTYLFTLVVDGKKLFNDKFVIVR